MWYCFSTGRVFVHEWAHYRWGVFDEYSNDMPFYVSRNSKAASVEATRYYFFHISAFTLHRFKRFNNVFNILVVCAEFVGCP